MFPKKISLGVSQVVIEWSDGHVSRFSSKHLREACPCALCVGEGPPIGTARVIPLTPAVREDVTAGSCTMVGRYAMAFAFSDGHSTGIYSYDHLRAICECDECAARRSRTGSTSQALK